MTITIFRIVVASALLQHVLGFTTQKLACLQRERLAYTHLFEIDEKSVTDSVSFDAKPKEKLVERSKPSPTVSTTASGSGVSIGDGGDSPLVAIAGGLFATFAVGTFLMRGRGDVSAPDTVSSVSKSKAAAPVDVGLSIPYDSAARIAYEEWRALHKKGDFDDSKFFIFKARYLAVTSDNMAAKKIAREKGIEPVLQVLSATADQ